MSPTKSLDKTPKSGDYFLIEDADILPPPRPPSKAPLPPGMAQKLNSLSTTSSYSFLSPSTESTTPPVTKPTPAKPTVKPLPPKDLENLTVWERQALRNAERRNKPTETEPRPREPTIWEKHAARKLQKERQKMLKEKESQVVHSDIPPPPRLSLIPAFRAFRNNQEMKSKEEEQRKESEEGKHQQQQPPSKPIPTRPRIVEQKSYNFNLTFQLYEAIIGAVGGVVVGIESGFFSKSRIPTPNVPLPQNSPMIGNFQTGVKNGATIWRFVKRATISAIMFTFLEQKMAEVRNRADWKNSAYSGFICGSLFGLRGGPRGVIVGGLGFTGFAAISALCKNLLPRKTF